MIGTLLSVRDANTWLSELSGTAKNPHPARNGRDTANAALFLTSDEARFIAGTEIVVDGGMTARCD